MVWERSSVEAQKQSTSLLPYRRMREFSEQLESKSSTKTEDLGLVQLTLEPGDETVGENSCY